jgi:hypothetical protein
MFADVVFLRQAAFRVGRMRAELGIGSSVTSENGAPH